MDADTQWDVAVIGGGPAGMMAAGQAAALGARVILIEKNPTLGKKLLITGGGRCNVTNAEPDMRKFLAKFEKNDKFLFSAFSQHAVADTLEFFKTHEMPTKVEANGRVFPVSDSAQSVWDVLADVMKKGKVRVVKKSPVKRLVVKEGVVEAVRLENGEDIRARSFILATGGKSRPETGSTGDGFAWLKEIGHTVVEQDAALVPVAIKDAWVKRLQGVSLAEIKLSVYQGGQKQGSREGKMLFTHFGVSGPAVLNLSREIGELLKYGDVALSLDLLPSLDQDKVDLKIQQAFKLDANKKFKNVISQIVPSALGPVIVELSKISPDLFCHSVTREQRLRLVKLLKDMPMNVDKLLGVDKAIVTSGGVALTEVDFKTMRSRKFENLYIVGDMLNISRPSGGYSLQLCWTTGFIAGVDSAKRV